MKNSPKKSQSAIEFIILASFMMLIVLGFLAVTSSNLIAAKEEGNRKIAEDIADFAYREIETAKTVNNGYIRVFNMPETVNGVEYSINITDNRELAVNYLDYEFVRFLPAEVCGDLSTDENQLTKEKGIVCINSNLDSSQCKAAQDLNICSETEELIAGAKCCCCGRYGFCC